MFIVHGAEVKMDVGNFPTCLACNKGVLVPLSDYGRDGAAIHFKAWVCTNLDCGFHMRIDNGELGIGREIKESYK